MRNHYLYISLSALLLTFTGCSNETGADVSSADKHPVMLSVGTDAPTTRAVITDGTDKTLDAFEAPTDIWMVMQSDYKALSGDNSNPDEIDYKGSQTRTNCVTYGTTGAKTGEDEKENIVNFSGENIRYWDDAHARSSALSIWAIAVPGVTGEPSKWKGKTAKTWTTTMEANKTIAWSLDAGQNETVVKNGDLCFSNNIVDYTPSGTDRRLVFQQDKKRFLAGKLVFYHALSKITIIMKEGDGFNTTSTADFNLDNINLKGFKLGGTFDVARGEFTDVDAETTTITSMYQKGKTAEDMTLEALVVPGTDLEAALDDAVSFSLDGNAFKVSAATLKEKLGGGFTSFEAGKNYVFTFVINKTDIVVTATVAGWEDVKGTNYSPLINFDQSYGAEGTDFADSFTLYLSKGSGDQASLDDDFAKGTDVTYADSKYNLDTRLYWPNHQKHYLFRGVWPLVGADGTPEGNVDKKGISVTNCAYDDETYPSDLMLGYPRKAGETCEAHGLDVTTKGICATEGTIRMNFQYAMSRVEVNLSTSDGDNKVIFDENTSIEIIGGYKEGAILFKDGSSDFTGKSTSVYGMHKEGDTNKKFHDAIIPQLLEGLKFRITVTDSDGKQDRYETVLGIKDIEVTPDGGSKTKIDEWKPGRHYVYNLYITKTEVKVRATIKDWEQTTGSTTIWM